MVTKFLEKNRKIFDWNGIKEALFRDFRMMLGVGQKQGASIFDDILIDILLTIVLSAVASTLVCNLDFKVLPGMAFHQTVSISISLLLVFRSNTAYSRFWEGRGHIGDLIKGVRSIALTARNDVIGPGLQSGEEAVIKAFQKQVHRYLEAFFLATCLLLHGESELDSVLGRQLRSNLTEAEWAVLEALPKNRGICVLHLLVGLAQWGYAKGFLTNSVQRLMVEEVQDLMTAYNGVTKILTTKLPFPYKQMCIWMVDMYCFTAPFCLASIFHDQGATDIYFNLPKTALSCVALTVCISGINATALELEDPFGTDPNDLDLDAFCGTVTRDLKGLFDIEIPPGRGGRCAQIRSESDQDKDLGRAV